MNKFIIILLHLCINLYLVYKCINELLSFELGIDNKCSLIIGENSILPVAPVIPNIPVAPVEPVLPCGPNGPVDPS
jgi:hypothetical protein